MNRTQENTSRASDYLSTAFNALSFPVVILSPTGDVVFTNSAADMFFTPHPPPKNGKNRCYEFFFGFSSPCHEKDLPCPLAMLLESKKETSVVRSQQATDGSTRWLEINAVPVLDEAGEVVEIIETICDITKRKEMENALQHYSRSQEELFRVSQEISSTIDLQQLYRRIVSHGKELLKVDFSTLMLFSEDKTGLVVRDTLGFPEAIINTFTVLNGEGLASYVAEMRHPEVVLDFKTEDRFEVPKMVVESKIRSALCVPMVVNKELLGVLVGHTLEKRVFTKQEIILYENLANQAAIALNSTKALQELKASEERYHDLFENSLDLIQMVGPDARLLYVNQAWKNVLGYDDEEITSLTAFDIIHPDCKGHCLAEFQRLGAGENVEYIETTFVTKEGKGLDVEGNISCKIKDGEIISTRGIFRDITERKLLEAKLEKISRSDELTGLLNRRGFFASGSKQLDIAERTGNKLFLLYADLDNMKLINDQLGHRVGDAALVETARLLQETFRNSDTIARVGGDEFTVLLPASPTTRESTAVLKRFAENLGRLNAEENRLYELSISTGIVAYNADSPSTIEELISQADNCMYKNKRERKALAASGKP